MTNKGEISIGQMEDGAADANSFLVTERGVGLDGAQAQKTIEAQIIGTQEQAEKILTSIPHPKHSGLYIPLSKHNAASYEDVAASLPGYVVLIPDALVGDSDSNFYPAVVSMDGITDDDKKLRLHVLKKPYRQGLTHGAAMILSAAGQSETEDIGRHGRTLHDGLEAEHFATLLTTASNSSVRRAWQDGDHVNHDWRTRNNSSVTTEVASRLFGDDVPQTTITLTKQQFENGRAFLAWHEGLRNENGPESATKDNALLVIQGLGFQAVQQKHPQGLDSIKELIAS